LQILEAEPINEDYKGEVGEIVKIDPKRGIIVKTGKGNLLIKKIQFPNSKPISAVDAVRGYHIKEGEKFS